MSNHKRIDALSREIRSAEGIRLLLTSNIPRLNREGCLYVDYDRYTNPDPVVSDNAGLMLLKLLQASGAREMFLAGFDGFQEQENYYSEELYLPVDIDEIEEKKIRIKKHIKELSRTAKLYFLTPSLYEGEEIYV